MLLSLRSFLAGLCLMPCALMAAPADDVSGVNPAMAPTDPQAQTSTPAPDVDHPSLLVWWVERNTDEGNSLLSDNQPEAGSLREAARTQGIPVVLPMGDLQEQLLIGNESKDGGVALAEAAHRYGANTVLLVSEGEQSEGGWQGSWQLSIGGKNETGKIQGDNRQALIDAVVQAVAEKWKTYASQPGVGEAPARLFDLQVSGVDLTHYAALQRVLAAFKGQLLSVQDEQVTYRVEANEERLRAQLASIQLFPSGAGQSGAVGSAPGADGAVSKLYFSW